MKRLCNGFEMAVKQPGNDCEMVMKRLCNGRETALKLSWNAFENILGWL